MVLLSDKDDGSGNSATARTTFSNENVPAENLPGTSRETQHTQPSWLEGLKTNFSGQIIEQCSARTRKAVDNDEKIEVIWKQIRAVNATLFVATERIQSH